ncbi:DUF6458 family protein [Actinoplanes sp. N902-109]|uniref:DUF6458 family protein n=1 Tax=Actinoplanes sp. (strain N902-109) TaxID=649831 RepID=UPI0003293CF5|nr:DUF6458 family protein [Actinoplanes sp. N902-109]AGL13594.1 hypothetical protein L083_0084 [Actinoplanes sp. N902-109]
MGIGGSIFLLALGAILAFAVNANISGLDINVVGYVLMLAGLVGLILTLYFWNSRRRPAAAVVDERQVVRDEPVYRDGQVVQEYHHTTRRQSPPPPPPSYGA